MWKLWCLGQRKKTNTQQHREDRDTTNKRNIMNHYNKMNNKGKDPTLKHGNKYVQGCCVIGFLGLEFIFNEDTICICIYIYILFFVVVHLDSSSHCTQLSNVLGCDSFVTKHNETVVQRPSDSTPLEITDTITQK